MPTSRPTSRPTRRTSLSCTCCRTSSGGFPARADGPRPRPGRPAPPPALEEVSGLPADLRRLGRRSALAGQRHRAGPHADLRPLARRLPVDAARRVRRGRGPAGGRDGQLRGRPPEHSAPAASLPQDILRIDQAMRDGVDSSRTRRLLGPLRARRAERDAAPHGPRLRRRRALALSAPLRPAEARAARRAVPRVFVHAFTDGRDTPPRAARRYIRQLEASLRARRRPRDRHASRGRYYAMDRDKRWDRVARAYAAAGLRQRPTDAGSAGEAVADAYAAARPTSSSSRPVRRSTTASRSAPIRDGDAVVFFNFRADRAAPDRRARSWRTDFTGFDRGRRAEASTSSTMTAVRRGLRRCPRLFRPGGPERDPGGRVAGEGGITNLRIAETEKYAHVTYFFNGGVEKAYPGEDRVLVPSRRWRPTTCTPEMSAPGDHRGGRALTGGRAGTTCSS